MDSNSQVQYIMSEVKKAFPIIPIQKIKEWVQSDNMAEVLQKARGYTLQARQQIPLQSRSVSGPKSQTGANVERYSHSRARSENVGNRKPRSAEENRNGNRNGYQPHTIKSNPNIPSSSRKQFSQSFCSTPIQQQECGNDDVQGWNVFERRTAQRTYDLPPKPSRFKALQSKLQLFFSQDDQRLLMELVRERVREQIDLEGMISDGSKLLIMSEPTWTDCVQLVGQKFHITFENIMIYCDKITMEAKFALGNELQKREMLMFFGGNESSKFIRSQPLKLALVLQGIVGAQLTTGKNVYNPDDFRKATRPKVISKNLSSG